ncbi:glycosyltransferase family 4 protein [Prosthecochloris sp. N3]|uniref:Glycosyltransferase family 4 protein n=1 Tax=Prosthecochloris ethylica TaxID=2743976 RepID=A0ABR9XSM5_9CHLB|nr:glycosyltransferase family 4 protein [Prosthecochloris ethylica]MBF0586876.1 glycosyltransferase family 4 protein [Prosthecochloris ethylica]MBF0636776.1 glycosyltransferase family 4 protein [Prosthecochloris ethylica]NUK47992.1 glycosyltransferase family 4 protein [Prosthecochloris ethylica]
MTTHYLIIADEFPPCKGGGIAEWALGIASNLAQNGLPVTVLSRWKTVADRDTNRNRLFSVRQMSGRDWNTFRYWYALFHLSRALRRHPDTMVIAATWELAAPMPLLQRIFRRSRYIVAAHGLEVTKLEQTGRIKQFTRTISNARLTIAVSRFTQQEIRKRLPDRTADRIIFLPNGVDTHRFRYTENYHHLEQQLSIAPGTRILLTLARVIDRKGHDTVLRAMPDILRRFPDTVYIIAGPGHPPTVRRLQALVDELGLDDHVRFTSFVDDSDLNAYYSMSDIYIMVSRTIEQAGDSEGFGITFLEANACGCPVIGSYAGGIPDAVEDGVNGFLVQPDDPAAVADRVIHLLGDRRLMEKIGHNGLERVRKGFTWKQVTAKLLDAVEGTER